VEALVLRSFVRKSNSIIEIETTRGKVRATSNHPFWVKSKGWASYEPSTEVEAKRPTQLEEGDELLDDQLRPTRIVSITLLYSEQLEEVYNFEVAETNTYFAEGLLVHNTSGEVFDKFNVNKSMFDPSYDYDFRKIIDTTVFSRGGKTYFRPCGWFRIAIKVLGRYTGGDTWLGATDASGVWYNAYHGTAPTNIDPITEDGLKVGGKGVPIKHGAAYGPGVYVSPLISYAKIYAPSVTVSGKNYRIVFQCRVRPGSFTEHALSSSGNLIWVVADGKDVRPYGLCLLEE